MKKSKKSLKSLHLKTVALMAVGLAMFITTGFFVNNNLGATDSSASSQVTVKYGNSANITKNNATVKVTANANGRGDYTLSAVTPKLSCTKRSGYFTCVFTTKPGVIVLYVSHLNNLTTKAVVFTVK